MWQNSPIVFLLLKRWVRSVTCCKIMSSFHGSCCCKCPTWPTSCLIFHNKITQAMAPVYSPRNRSLGNFTLIWQFTRMLIWAIWSLWTSHHSSCLFVSRQHNRLKLLLHNFIFGQQKLYAFITSWSWPWKCLQVWHSGHWLNSLIQMWCIPQTHLVAFSICIYFIWTSCDYLYCKNIHTYDLVSKMVQCPFLMRFIGPSLFLPSLPLTFKHRIRV